MVITTGVSLGGSIADGLAAHGGSVALVSDTAKTCGSAVHHMSCDFTSVNVVADSIAAAQSKVGAPDLFVVSAISPAATRSQPLISMSDSDWNTACDGAIYSALITLQAISSVLSDRSASVVLLGPSLSLAGCEGLVALSTALEGQRGLVKSVARQWGERGVAVNWVSLAAEAFGDTFADATLPFKMDAVPIALGRRPNLTDELPALLGYLASPAGRAVTGASFNFDGGEWMLP